LRGVPLNCPQPHPSSIVLSQQAPIKEAFMLRATHLAVIAALSVATSEVVS
jgi:hypothetical protein